MTDSFSASFAHLHLLRHPFYQEWMSGTLPRATLRHYAAQYYHHVDHFPRYLSALHSLCESPAPRREILDNLNEEEGTAFGVSHPELWLQFAQGVGSTRAETMAALPGPAIRNVVATFQRFSRASYAEGLGALFAYESQVPEIAESKLEGLRLQYGIADEGTLAFFEVHRQADVGHRAVILGMLEALSHEEKSMAMRAATAAAQSLWNFLTEMHEHRCA